MVGGQAFRGVAKSSACDGMAARYADMHFSRPGLRANWASRREGRETTVTAFPSEYLRSGKNASRRPRNRRKARSLTPLMGTEPYGGLGGNRYHHQENERDRPRSDRTRRGECD